MKLLIITQKVDIDDPILGFFHRWIEEFSKHAEAVIVVCLYEGKHSLPSNVKVLSLGKEKQFSRIQYIIHFYKYIWKERNNYDAVFVHMNQIYVILGALIWKIHHKVVGLWYLHRQVTISLRIAVILVDMVFSASKESFRLLTKKLKIVGHGIDVKVFKESDHGVLNDIPVVITAGRISPVKNILLMLQAIKALQDNGVTLDFYIVGDAIYPADFEYLKKLKLFVEQEGLVNQVKFLGKITHNKMPQIYRRGDIFLNLSDTGSVDKVVLEAMACGLKILTSNEAFRHILDEQYRTNKDPVKIAEKIKYLVRSSKDNSLVSYVITEHNIETLIPKIINFYTQKYT